MSILDVLTGRKPLMRSTSFRGFVREIETEFATLINGATGRNWETHPMPAADVVAAEQAAADKPILQAGARYTLSATLPQKICDTRGQQRRIAITVLGQGKTAYLSHNFFRLTNRASGQPEGVPVTAAAIGEPVLTALPWIGEMWAVSAADGTVVDVELL